MRWLRYSAHFMGLAPSGPLPAAFKSAYANLSLTPVTYLCKLLGIHSVAALQGSNEPCPKGPMRRVVQHENVLSCNPNYLGYLFFIHHQYQVKSSPLLLVNKIGQCVAVCAAYVAIAFFHCPGIGEKQQWDNPLLFHRQFGCLL